LILKQFTQWFPILVHNRPCSGGFKYNPARNPSTFLCRSSPYEIPASLHRRVKHQGGLKLEKGRTEIEVTVIDQFDKTPTEN
jgi:uncharacterized protein (TIGR03435 family)